MGIAIGMKAEAACISNRGRIRKVNEDNYFFGGQCRPAELMDLSEPLVRQDRLWKPLRMAVFDGMGGEAYGEDASRTAAELMCAMSEKQKLRELLRPEEEVLQELCESLNRAVAERAMDLGVDRIGSTLAELTLCRNSAYICNLGDSPVFRLRNGALEKLSRDHVQKREGHHKSPITRFLGLDPEEFLVEPTITKHELYPGDLFLLCSDGVTDMLGEEELIGYLTGMESVAETAGAILAAALERGGKDNTTLILCRVFSGIVLPDLHPVDENAGE